MLDEDLTLLCGAAGLRLWTVRFHVVEPEGHLGVDWPQLTWISLPQGNLLCEPADASIDRYFCIRSICDAPTLHTCRVLHQATLLCLKQNSTTGIQLKNKLRPGKSCSKHTSSRLLWSGHSGIENLAQPTAQQPLVQYHGPALKGDISALGNSSIYAPLALTLQGAASECLFGFFSCLGLQLQHCCL